MADTAVAANAPPATTEPAAPREATPMTALRWLDHAPPLSPAGISFGVPWARGTVPGNQIFHLEGTDGQAIPTQSWPLAYWPDGSLKWVGLAIAADSQLAGPFHVAPGASPAPSSPVTVREADQAVTVSTGKLVCSIARSGGTIS